MMTHAFYLSLDFVEILFPVIMNATSTIKELEFFALLFRYNCTFEKNRKDNLHNAIAREWCYMHCT